MLLRFDYPASNSPQKSFANVACAQIDETSLPSTLSRCVILFRCVISASSRHLEREKLIGGCVEQFTSGSTPQVWGIDSDVRRLRMVKC